jgi:hypothetical protein
MRAKIRHLMPLAAQEFDHWAFEWKAGVIATNGEFIVRSLLLHVDCLGRGLEHHRIAGHQRQQDLA